MAVSKPAEAKPAEAAAPEVPVEAAGSNWEAPVAHLVSAVNRLRHDPNIKGVDLSRVDAALVDVVGLFG